MAKTSSSDADVPYRARYSIDLKDYEEVILKLAAKEDRGKANMVKQLIKEALIARGEIEA